MSLSKRWASSAGRWCIAHPPTNQATPDFHDGPSVKTDSPLLFAFLVFFLVINVLPVVDVLKTIHQLATKGSHESKERESD
jgi:hypothetical protein